MSMPSYAEVNDAMQQLTGVKYIIPVSSTRKPKRQDNCKDTNELITFLSQRNLFNSNPSLRSITSAVVAEDDVNADKAKEVGGKILSSMVGKNVHDYSFLRDE